MTNKVQLNAATQLANLGEELNVPFLKLLGVRLISAEMGKGEILLALKPEHTNTWDVAHGGVLLTLMDVAMAVAARSSDPGDRSVVTVEMKNNFICSNFYYTSKKHFHKTPFSHIKTNFSKNFQPKSL